jgi:hypothetical protein
MQEHDQKPVFLTQDFTEFTQLDADRLTILSRILEEKQIPFSIIPIDDKKHVYVQFPQSSYSPLFKIKTVLVHYDKDPESQGANDNSACVFQVIEWIESLIASNTVHNIRIFFTDGEEIGCAIDQGAFGIASRFKKLGLTNDEVFVLDGCGRGDVLVISSTGKKAPGNAEFKKRFYELYEDAISIAKSAAAENWITVPVPYSDNAGFIACGIPAVAITILPRDEATLYMRKLQKDKQFETFILEHRTGYSSMSEKDIPLTWRLMHSKQDDTASLTPEAFALMKRFLSFLGRHKTMA